MNMADRYEREAYYDGRSSVIGLDRSEPIPDNPYDMESELNLFIAWELGFNDGFEEEVDNDRLLDGLI